MQKIRQTKQEKMETYLSDLRSIDSSLESNLHDLYSTQARVDSLRTKRTLLQEKIRVLAEGRKKVKKNA